MDKAIDAFGLHLATERNLSPHTLRSYLADLRQFRQYLEENGLILPDASRPSTTWPFVLFSARFTAGRSGR
jgi:site-specific recombinase XerD